MHSKMHTLNLSHNNLSLFAFEDLFIQNFKILDLSYNHLRSLRGEKDSIEIESKTPNNVVEENVVEHQVGKDYGLYLIIAFTCIISIF